MANRAYLLLCPSPSSVQQWIDGQRTGDPILIAGPKYHLPPLWIGGFSSADVGEVLRDGQSSYLVLRTDGATALARWKAHRDLRVGLVHHFDEVLDAWIEYLERSVPCHLLLDMRELFMMDEFQATRAALDEILGAFASPEGDGLAKILGYELSSVEHLLATGTREDRSAAWRQLMGYGPNWPPELTEPCGSTLSELMCDRATALVRGAFVSLIPRVALDALWLRGLYDETYRLAGWRSPVELAWYAGLDPEPSSERALRASEVALRQSAPGTDLAEVLAAVPTARQEVLALARELVPRRSHGDWIAQEVLALRRDDRHRTETHGASGLIGVLMAERTDEPRWFEAANDAIEICGTGITTLRMLRLGWRHDRWPRLHDLPRHVLTAAALQARADSSQALAKLMAWLPDESALLTMNTLDLAPPPPSSQLESEYAEGLIDEWELDFARARHEHEYEEQEAVSSTVVRFLAKGQRLAIAFTEALQAVSSPSSIDPAAVDRARASVIEGAHNTGPTRGTLRRLARPMTVLAEHGTGEELRAVVSTLEESWGPVASWHETHGFQGRDSLFRLLAGAQGYAEAASQLLNGLTRVVHREVAAAHVLVGLAREGHEDSALQGLREAIQSRSLSTDRSHETDAVVFAQQVRALSYVDSDGARRVVDAATAAFSSLPGDLAAIRDWLGAAGGAAQGQARGHGSATQPAVREDLVG